MEIARGMGWQYIEVSRRMKFIRALLLIPAALVVIGVRLLDRFGVNIKFSNFLSSRIGHLVGNTEVYLCERDLGMHSGIHIWTHYGKISSKQIALMWSRVMRVWPSYFTALVILINKMFPGWERHEIGSSTMDRDPRNLLEKCKVHLRFTSEEIMRGEAQLRKWGLSAGDQWVCLMVRDAAYLPHLTYHAYRDCDVDTYADAALMLAERGYYVFRMGVKVAKPFSVKHPRIFDFATNGMYSDFMGVYLGAYCSFCISTSTGWDAIPQAFRRPMCYTNFAPLEYINTWVPNSLVIWKHYRQDIMVDMKPKLINGRWGVYGEDGKEMENRYYPGEELVKGEGKRMSIEQIRNSGAGRFMRLDQFEEAGIVLVDNTPEEITEVVREMADMMEGKFNPDPQKKFWDVFPRYFELTNGQPLHGEIRTRIGSKFLKEYEEQLDAEKQEDTGDNSSARRLQAGGI